MAEGRRLLGWAAGGGSSNIQTRRERGERGGSDLSGNSDVWVDVALLTAGEATALQGQAALCRQEVADGAAPQSCCCRWAGPQWPPGQRGREQTWDPLQALPTPVPLPGLLTSPGMRPHL